jgi:hypothetical protein
MRARKHLSKKLLRQCFLAIFVAVCGLYVLFSPGLVFAAGADYYATWCTFDANNDGVVDYGTYVPARGQCAFSLHGQIGPLTYLDPQPAPMKLQEVEFLFVKVLYVLWGISGVVFTLILMSIGIENMTAGGNEFLKANVIQRLRKWAIGLVLVFLSYPILNTVFKLLPLDQSVTCYSDLYSGGSFAIGFNFFFPDICAP